MDVAELEYLACSTAAVNAFLCYLKHWTSFLFFSPNKSHLIRLWSLWISHRLSCRPLALIGRRWENARRQPLRSAESVLRRSRSKLRSKRCSVCRINKTLNGFRTYVHQTHEGLRIFCMRRERKLMRHSDNSHWMLTQSVFWNVVIGTWRCRRCLSRCPPTERSDSLWGHPDVWTWRQRADLSIPDCVFTS